MFTKTPKQLFLPTRLCFQRIKLVLYALIFTITSTIGGLITISPAAFATGCNDLEIIFARGSGESLGAPNNQAWENSLRSALRTTLSTLSPQPTYHFYELGSDPTSSHSYSAVAVDNLGKALDTMISAGQTLEFASSIAEGQQELIDYINSFSRSCPATKFIIGGYSQGAIVISGSLEKLDARKILYAATFGDPKLYLPEGRLKNARDLPEACYGKNLSEYRIYAPNCFDYEGILGSLHYYQPVGYSGKLGIWCNDNDIMCSAGLSMSDHTSYYTKNFYADAAAIISSKVRSYYDASAIGPAVFNGHQVAFLVDRTGSMSSQVSITRSELITLGDKVISGGGSVALYSYGDLYIGETTRLECEFGCSLASLESKIDALSYDGGGDAPESVLGALNKVLHNEGWQHSTKKTIVLITDASFHDPDADESTTSSIISLAASKNINLYTITPAYIESTYAKLTESTGGHTYALDDYEDIFSTSILERPTINIPITSYTVPLGSTITFDASRSYPRLNIPITGISTFSLAPEPDDTTSDLDQESGDTTSGPDSIVSTFGLEADSNGLTFDWDLDGDGEFELEDGPSIMTKTYPAAYNGFARVRVTDSFGFSSTATFTVSVYDDDSEPALPSISNLSATPSSVTRSVTSDYAISFDTDASSVMVALGDAILGLAPLSSGHSEFTITDIAEPTILRLIPYTDRRGLAEEVTLGSVEASPETPEQGSTSPKPSAGSTTSASTGLGATTSSATKKPALSSPASTTTIPLAPNAGHRARRD